MRLNNSELQEFLKAEVDAGTFVSIDAAVEAAVARMKEEFDSEEELDDDLLRHLEEADAQVARGDYYTIEQVKAMFAEKITQRP